MSNDEAFGKIMKAADMWASWCAFKELSECRGSSEDLERCENKVAQYKWELEQMVKAALFAVAKEGE